VDPGYALPTEGYLGKSFTSESASARGFGFGNVFTEAGELKLGAVQGGDAFIADMSIAASNVVRIRNRHPLGDLAIGDRFAWPARVAGGGQAVALRLCTQCRVEAVTVHSAPVLAFMANDSDALEFVKCVIDVPAKSGRLYAGNADGVHCKSARRGPLVEGCRFERHGDDSVTVVQGGERVMGQPSATEIIVEHSQYQLFRTGDRVAAINQATGLTTAEAKIVDVALVRYKGALGRKLTLDKAMRGLVTADSLGFDAMPARASGHDRTTELAKRPDVLADLDALGTGFTVRNNVFANHRASGMRIYSDGGTVEGNRFENLASYGLRIGMELAWPEVHDASNIAIRNNTFTNLSNTANIWIHSLLGDYSQAQGQGNHDISIEGNTFTGYGARLGGQALAAITVSNGQAIRIENNTFSSPCSGLPKPPEAIRVDVAKDVTIRGNTIAKPGADNPIAITPHADRATITLASNRITRP
jgi:hypothetical protein